ncbi:OPT-domain-containing protein [Tilletiaria anomala UBC 951]|uniref:OPT-domain-containing protein n=1 Tax=Tilletiaria anomala (strain ATCC 24038 / CBS 436.72 / UBC 951) TaxID=1037660 RepID=A0A066VLW4_TILAU|nr:OPT-domain-containing protein [Tilletiaria anomala UBC 951]KDN39744.1 OPT-domain-containing protein [Tilletiaria anomala UBC 951]
MADRPGAPSSATGIPFTPLCNRMLDSSGASSMTIPDGLPSLRSNGVNDISSGNSTRKQGYGRGYEDDDEGEGEDIELNRLLPERSRSRLSLDTIEGGYGRSPRTLDEGKSGFATDDDDDSDDPMILVSKAVPETDDPTLPALTVRVILIGSVLCVVGAAISQLFFYKSNSPSFSAYFVILISLPIGRWLAKVMPAWRVIVPIIGEFSLNPGPFSIKEHLLIAVLVTSGATSAYASDIINIQELFFKQHMSTASSLVLLLTTQTLGFGFAGIVHNILVKPVAMIYPSSLVTTSLFHTLHGQGSKLTTVRLRFFIIIFVAIFIYQFIPTLIIPSLSSIALLCLVDNRNPTFRVLSSGYKGFGLLNFSLDWNAIGTSGPLFQPWAACNFYAGIAGMMYIVTPILYFFNFWDAKRFPSPVGPDLFNSTFHKFEVNTILTSDNSLDPAKWLAAKPLLLTPFFALTYGLSFAILTSMITHVYLWHSKDIKRALFYPHYDDAHNRLMMAYHNVPTSWYLTVLGLSMTGSIWLVATHDELQLPIWGLLLATCIGFAFLVPVGVLKAVSDTSIGLNVITEFVAGFFIPGKPIANVLFKAQGYLSMSQALDLVSDLKLAHYMKIPPKHMFITQILGTVIGCCVNLIVVNIVLSPKSGYRAFLDGSKVDPTGQWDGRKVHIFYSASVIWGVVGPAQFFTGKYSILYWGFLAGLVLPIIPWLLHKRWGRKLPFRRVAFPILLHAAAGPPQIPTNIITSGFIAAWLSQKYAREKHPRWFERFNYVLSAALDAGSSINALCCFLLSITVLKMFAMPHWAGNPVRDSEHCTPAN